MYANEYCSGGHMRTTQRRRDEIEAVAVHSDGDSGGSSSPRRRRLTVHETFATPCGHETTKRQSSSSPLDDEDFTQLLKHFEKKTSMRTLRRVDTLPPRSALALQTSPSLDGSRNRVELVKSASKLPSVQLAASLRSAANGDDDGPLLMSKQPIKVNTIKKRTTATASSAVRANKTSTVTTQAKVQAQTKLVNAKVATRTTTTVAKTKPSQPLTAAALRSQQAAAQHAVPSMMGVSSPPPRHPQEAENVGKRHIGRHRSATILFSYEQDEPSQSVQFQTISEEQDLHFYAEDGRLVVSPPPAYTIHNVLTSTSLDHVASSVSEAADDITFMECPTPPKHLSPSSNVSMVLVPVDAAQLLRQSTPPPAATSAQAAEPLLISGPTKSTTHVHKVPPFRAGGTSSRPVSPGTSRSHTPRTPKTTVGRIAPGKAPAPQAGPSALPATMVARVPPRPLQRSPRGVRGEVQRPTPAFSSINDLESVEQERRGDLVGRENAISGIISSHAMREFTQLWLAQLSSCSQEESKHREVLVNIWAVELQMEAEPLLMSMATRHKQESLRFAIFSAGSAVYQAAQRSGRLEIMCDERLCFGGLLSQHTAIQRRVEIAAGDESSSDRHEEEQASLGFEGIDADVCRSSTTSPQFTILTHDDDVSAVQSRLQSEEAVTLRVARLAALQVLESNARSQLGCSVDIESLKLSELMSRTTLQLTSWGMLGVKWASLWSSLHEAVLCAAQHQHAAVLSAALVDVMEPALRAEHMRQWGRIVASTVSQQECTQRSLIIERCARSQQWLQCVHMREREWSFNVSVAGCARAAIVRQEHRERRALEASFRVPERPIDTITPKAPSVNCEALQRLMSDEAQQRRKALQVFVVEHAGHTSAFTQGLLSITLLSEPQL